MTTRYYIQYMVRTLLAASKTGRSIHCRADGMTCRQKSAASFYFIHASVNKIANSFC